MSKIEWTGKTWNPLAGCRILSPGCTNCYAMKLAYRLAAMGQAKYQGTTKLTKGGPVWTGRINTDDAALDIPLKTKKPTTWFLNSMSDLFVEGVETSFLDRVFAVMAITPQHTYQILTKRPDRMRDYMHRLMVEPCHVGSIVDDMGGDWSQVSTPLPNVWLGTSVERQQEADQRIPRLLQTPAAVRFLSCEPLLGPVDLTRIPWRFNAFSGETVKTVNALTGNITVNDPVFGGGGGIVGIDWVICGGESGPSARPMHPDWARSLRDQCQAAGVPFFFKQWGDWHPASHHENGALYQFEGAAPFDSWKTPVFDPDQTEGINFRRLGKAKAGRLLDGRTWDEMPTTTAPQIQAAE